MVAATAKRLWGSQLRLKSRKELTSLRFSGATVLIWFASRPRSTTIRNAASLKKFYRFLHENGIVDKVTLEAVRETTKTGLPEWLATLARYDDPDIDDPAEVWGF